MHTRAMKNKLESSQGKHHIKDRGHNDERPDNCIRDALDFVARHLKKKKSIKIIS